MPTKFTQVDSFTPVPFAGNPAAVIVLERPAETRWMALVAREMNLSETAFLVRTGACFSLRWFTPEIEVDLCGHATLASAHVLWQEGHLPPDSRAFFSTRSGQLTAALGGEWIEMDFPARPEQAVAPPAGLEAALGARAVYVGRNVDDLIVELADPATLRGLEPDLLALKRLGVRGVIVTTRSDDASYDFLSRFFAPGSGVPEDPVTGSAHCCLAPFWQRRLGRDAMVGYQASTRGGVVKVKLAGDRVLLSGQAVTVARGELLD